MKKIKIVLIAMLMLFSISVHAQQNADFLRGVKTGKADAVYALMGYGSWTTGPTGFEITPGTGPTLQSVSFDADTGIITLTYSDRTRTDISLVSSSMFQWAYPAAQSDFQTYKIQYLDNLNMAAINAATQEEAQFYYGIASGFDLASSAF